MKMTIQIEEDLLKRAEAYARSRGLTHKEVVEQGPVLVLEACAPPAYRLPDCSVGNPNSVDPLEDVTWEHLRDEIYGRPGRR